jgi:hypothetical protein
MNAMLGHGIKRFDLSTEAADFGQRSGNVAQRELVWLRVDEVEVSTAAKSDRVLNASKCCNAHGLPFVLVPRPLHQERWGYARLLALARDFHLAAVVAILHRPAAFASWLKAQVATLACPVTIRTAIAAQGFAVAAAIWASLFHLARLSLN